MFQSIYHSVYETFSMRPLLTDFSLNMRTKVDNWQDRATLGFALPFSIKALSKTNSVDNEKLYV
ncbi:hypothetical protein I310_05571 [Cryptococcus deuterogattii CA1014]|nr:hypothetical protein I310_05571 [Cryptococcus deuterogattii CA1014]